MKSTPAQWVIVIVLFGILIALFLDGKPFLDPNWVIAIATVVLAATTLVGLIGVLGPIQEAARRQRKLHFDKLKAEVIDWIVVDLKHNCQGILMRKVHPLGWDNGQGLHLGPHRKFEWAAQSTAPADSDLYDSYYEDLKRNHYPLVVGDLETFKKDFKVFKDFTLDQAKRLEQELRGFTDLPESSIPDGERWFSAGNLALFVFNAVWLKEFSGEITVRRAQPPQQESWELLNIGISTTYARGDEAAIRKLKAFIDAMIQRQDRQAFTKDAVDLDVRLNALQDTLARIRASVKLEGDCEATQ